MYEAKIAFVAVFSKYRSEKTSLAGFRTSSFKCSVSFLGMFATWPTFLRNPDRVVATENTPRDPRRETGSFLIPCADRLRVKFVERRAGD